MKYSLTFCEQDYHLLTSHLFTGEKVERAAYALCRLSLSEEETRLTVREILPVGADEVQEASSSHMVVAARSFLRAMKKADQTRQAFVFIHSHPGGLPEHSVQDDAEERKLFKTAFIRIATIGVH